MRSILNASLLLLPALALAQNPVLPPENVWTTRRVFPALTFSQPVLMLEAPDASGRLFVFERRGRVKSFLKSDPTTVTTVLDISARVADNPVSDFALNGGTFDPDFATNGRLYIHYNWKNGTAIDDPDYGSARISRFTAVGAAETIDEATEEVLFQRRKPMLNGKVLVDHNGGSIEFGPDGMLYIAFGDGGSNKSLLNTDPAGQNPLGLAQDTTNHFSAILRLDVTGEPDPGLAYAIPPDNPFFTEGPDPATMKEIYAWGLRNPWRFSFDQAGRMICVDVGAKTREEINHIRPGRNYGWSVMEGSTCFPVGTNCDTTPYEPPIVDFLWTNGEFRSLTGGYTYSSARIPFLNGVFIFADYVNGGIWGMAYDGTSAPISKMLDTSELIAGFGKDQEGEVYLLGFTSGRILVLDPPPLGTWSVR